MEIGVVCSWVYCIIGMIVFMWLSEHFYMENKETGEEYSMAESVRCMVIGSLIAIGWIVCVPILVRGGFR